MKVFGIVLRNLAKLTDDKSQRALDMMENRLLALTIDLRGQLASADEKLVVLAQKPPGMGAHNSEYIIHVQKREIIKEQIKTVDGLMQDLNAILQRVHAGA